MLNIRQSKLAYRLAALLACLGLIGLADVARAQQPTPAKRVAILLVGGLPQSPVGAAFRNGLRDAGYTEGHDVLLEWRSAQGDVSRVPTLIADLLQTHPQVIVVDTTAAARAAKQATSTIPIVMVTVGDPLGSGLIESLAHPGGNVTGLSMMMRELAPKRLALFKEAIPTLKRVGILWDPSVDWHRKAIDNLKPVAQTLGFALVPVPAQHVDDFEAAFSALRQARVDGVSVLDSAFFFASRAVLIREATRARLPVMFFEKTFVRDGGLLSYSAEIVDMFRRSAGYVDRILKGARPNELPVEQPIKFELVVNMRSAKVLGLAIPQSILLQADEVIK